MTLKLYIELCVAAKETTSENKIKYSTGSGIQAENQVSEILTNKTIISRKGSSEKDVPTPTQSLLIEDFQYVITNN